jgi:hypothetical protein
MGNWLLPRPSFFPDFSSSHPPILHFISFGLLPCAMAQIYLPLQSINFPLANKLIKFYLLILVKFAGKSISNSNGGLRSQDQGLPLCGLFDGVLLRYFPPLCLFHSANAQKLCFQCGIEYGQGIDGLSGLQTAKFLLIDLVPPGRGGGLIWLKFLFSPILWPLRVLEL